MQAMRWILVVSVAWVLSACPKHDNVQCRDSTSCDLAPGGAASVAIAKMQITVPDQAFVSMRRKT